MSAPHWGGNREGRASARPEQGRQYRLHAATGTTGTAGTTGTTEGLPGRAGQCGDMQPAVGGEPYTDTASPF
ncbi:MAG: hypothetical protein ACOYD3_05125 [Kiritimatiellia bacterium]